MLPYPDIDPVAISIGPVKVHWYGLMYLIGIGSAWFLGRKRTQEVGFPWTSEQVEDVIFYTACGLIIGGRVGYVLFYNATAFMQDPLMLFRIWEGGMSFHGGMLGALAGMGLFARHTGSAILDVTDFIAPYVPIGLFTGRVGNFINGELWGKPTDLPWSMVFPAAGPEPRHPSQLYEAFLEGILLFLILHLTRHTTVRRGTLTGLFLLLYGIFRFSVEFVRLPDAHIGYLAFGWFTMGQLLSLPMVLFGAGLLVFSKRSSNI